MIRYIFLLLVFLQSALVVGAEGRMTCHSGIQGGCQDLIKAQQLQAFKSSSHSRLMPNDTWFVNRAYDDDRDMQAIGEGRWVASSVVKHKKNP